MGIREGVGRKLDDPPWELAENVTRPIVLALSNPLLMPRLLRPTPSTGLAAGWSSPLVALSRRRTTTAGSEGLAKPTDDLDAAIEAISWNPEYLPYEPV